MIYYFYCVFLIPQFVIKDTICLKLYKFLVTNKKVYKIRIYLKLMTICLNLVFDNMKQRVELKVFKR